MLMRFIGENGSMGLVHGNVYSVRIFSYGPCIYVRWKNNFCPYSSFKKLQENWSDID